MTRRRSSAYRFTVPPDGMQSIYSFPKGDCEVTFASPWKEQYEALLAEARVKNAKARALARQQRLSRDMGFWKERVLRRYNGPRYGRRNGQSMCLSRYAMSCRVYVYQEWVSF